MKGLGKKQKGGQHDDCDYKLIKTMFEDNVNAVGVFQDGSRIVSVNYQGTIQVWDINTGEKLRTLTHDSNNQYNRLYALDVFPDGSKIVTGSGVPSDNEGNVKIWDTDTWAVLHTFEGHTDTVASVAVFPDGKKIVSGSMDMTVKIWDVNTGDLLYDLDEHTDWVLTVAVFPDGKKIVSGSMDGTVNIWTHDVDTWKIHRSLSIGTQVNTVAVFPDGRKIVTGGHDGIVKIWDMESGINSCTLLGYRDVKSVAVFPNGKKIVIGSGERAIEIWDINTKKVLYTMHCGSTQWTDSGHRVMDVVLFPNGNGIVAGNLDGTIKIWKENTMVLTRKANDVVDKIGVNDDIIKMIKDKLPTCRKELNNLWEK